MGQRTKNLARLLGGKLEKLLYPTRKKAHNKGLIFSLFIVVAFLITLLAWYLSSVNIQVLNPAGLIGADERKLMLFTIILGEIVIIPVFVMTSFVVWKYRDTNKRPKKYNPEWSTNIIAESIWWGVPIVIISVLATATWITTYKLDPYKPIQSGNARMKIQAVAMDWKWLFIYPDQNIATVNYVQFPKDTQVDFELTSDAPMNSFWIPQLGGQMYTMPGMMTHLYLIADKTGNYDGYSANISGKGFAGMSFTAQASSQSDFEKWVSYAKSSGNTLNQAAYDKLAKPSINNAIVYYSSVDQSLYGNMVMKYMMPMNNTDSGDHTMPYTNTGMSS